MSNTVMAGHLDPGAKSGTTAITIEFNSNALSGYDDSYLALLWHVGQHNPAPLEDKAAGELVERIGREIVRRWLRTVEPELWHHQGRHHYWATLTAIAKYEPGGGPAGSPDWDNGRWVAKSEPDASAGGGA